MAEDNPREVNLPPSQVNTEQRTMRTVLIGSSIIFWILAVFMINVLNATTTQLQQINRRLDLLISLIGQQNQDNYELVKPDGAAAYRIRRKDPVDPMDPHADPYMRQNEHPAPPVPMPRPE